MCAISARKNWKEKLKAEAENWGLSIFRFDRRFLLIRKIRDPVFLKLIGR
jgi:hypothetical protein